MQKILIEQLQVPCLIGVYDFERTQKTTLLITTALYADVSAATLSDKVEDTVDYAKVAELIQQVAAASSFQLLEALGRALCQAVLAQFPISKISMMLEKPDILPDAKTVSVTLEFEQSDAL